MRITEYNEIIFDDSENNKIIIIDLETYKKIMNIKTTTGFYQYRDEIVFCKTIMGRSFKVEMSDYEIAFENLNKEYPGYTDL